MSLFNYYKTIAETHKEALEKSEQSSQINEDLIKKANQIVAELQHFHGHTTETLNQLTDLQNIIKNAPLTDLETSFQRIKQSLSTEACYATLLAERWGNQIFCPYCASTDIEIFLPETNPESRYQCKACSKFFNEDSNTDIESGEHALELWTLCWYLYGCTDSLSEIAEKLHLSLEQVEYMIKVLTKLFKSEQPLEYFHDKYTKAAQNLAKKVHSTVIKTGETADVPKDTAEYRRQQTRRRNPSLS